MLSEQERKFLDYWKENRLYEKSIFRQLQAGLPIGLSLSAGILICVFSGWYRRAMMEVSTELSPVVLIVATIIITIVCGIFYKKQQWDRNEQAYRELLIKQKKENTQRV